MTKTFHLNHLLHHKCPRLLLFSGSLYGNLDPLIILILDLINHLNPLPTNHLNPVSHDLCGMPKLLRTKLMAFSGLSMAASLSRCRFQSGLTHFFTGERADRVALRVWLRRARVTRCDSTMRCRRAVNDCRDWNFSTSFLSANTFCNVRPHHANITL